MLNACWCIYVTTGNHLFYFHPHPTNEHTKNYEVILTDILKVSRIKRIDLSHSNIAGYSGRELMGFTYMMREYIIHAQAFKCRMNHLNSQGFRVVSEALGVMSSLTYLDLSNNLGDLDDDDDHDDDDDGDDDDDDDYNNIDGDDDIDHDDDGDDIDHDDDYDDC